MRMPKTMRGWALAAFAGVWSLFVGVVVVGFLTAWVTQHRWFDNPDNTVRHVAAWVLYVAASPWAAWPLGLLLGLTAGFASGMWLNGLPRRKNLENAKWQDGAKPTLPAPSAPAVKQATKPSGPQLGSWEYIDRFRVSDAANLWADFLPSGSFMFDKAQRPAVVSAERLLVSELREAFDFRDAPTYRVPGNFADAYVYRKDLLKLAERLKVKPVFLYPRGNPDAAT